MELCRQHDASAQAAWEEALRFAKETRESAAREALEAETASKWQEIAAAEQKFIADSKVTENSLEEIRERLDARGK